MNLTTFGSVLPDVQESEEQMQQHRKQRGGREDAWRIQDYSAINNRTGMIIMQLIAFIEILRSLNRKQ